MTKEQFDNAGIRIEGDTVIIMGVKYKRIEEPTGYPLTDENSPILGFDGVLDEHVIVDFDIPNKIISAKFKPGSPFKRVNVFLFYHHIVEQFKIVDDLLRIPIFVGMDLVEVDHIYLKRVFILKDGWDFSEDTKKILIGPWSCETNGY